MCVCVCVFSLLVQLPCWLSGSWKGFVVICKKQKPKYFLVSGTQVKKKNISHVEDGFSLSSSLPPTHWCRWERVRGSRWVLLFCRWRAYSGSANDWSPRLRRNINLGHSFGPGWAELYFFFFFFYCNFLWPWASFRARDSVCVMCSPIIPS